jgi:sec-independent protein translocase protein TatA
MFGLGMGELVIIGFIVVLMFGGKKLPQLGSSLGESIKNFKKGMKEDDKDDDKNNKA